MTYFTDSPFERMMMQKPSGRHETEALPPGHPCRGCEYYKGEICVGICWKEFFRTEIKAAKI
jgi:hypothetical protein